MDSRWKGRRRGICANVPPAFGLAIKRTAERYELSLTDLVQDLLALELGHPTRVLTGRLELRNLPDVAQLLRGERDWRAPVSDLVEIQGRMPEAIVNDVQRLAVHAGTTIRFEARNLLARAYGLEATADPPLTGPRQRGLVGARLNEETLMLTG